MKFNNAFVLCPFFFFRRRKEAYILYFVDSVPVFAEIGNFFIDFLLHLDEKASFADVLHLVPDLGDKALHRGIKLAHQNLEHLLIAWHRLGKNEIAVLNERTVFPMEGHLVVCTLCSEPKA